MTDEKLAQMIKEYVDMKMKSTLAEYSKQIDSRFDEAEDNRKSATDDIIELIHDENKAQDKTVNDQLKLSQKYIVEFSDKVTAFQESFTKAEKTLTSITESISEIETSVEEGIDEVRGDLLKATTESMDFITEANKTNIENANDKAQENEAFIQSSFSDASEQLNKLFNDLSTQTTKDFKALELTDKVYMQDDLLRLNDHINTKLSVLKGDKGDVGEPGIDGKNGEKGEKGSDGDSLVHRGDYVKDKAYSNLSLVLHNGTTFVAAEEITGSPPGNGWRVVASKGAKGNRGEKGLTGERGLKGDRGEIDIEENIAIVEEILK